MSGDGASLLQVRSLTKSFPAPVSFLSRLAGRVPPPRPVIQDIDLDLCEGEVLGLVGESGSGKSTTAMVLMRLLPSDTGQIIFRGEDITQGKGAQLRAFRRNAQLILQDPYQSINPRFTVFQTVSEPLRIHGQARGAALRQRTIEALEQVGLTHVQALLDRSPAGLSGGQRQRVSIARAMILEPRLLVADEPVSMLDVSIRAGVLRLLKRLARERQLGVLYISHDIATVRFLCDRIAVMYLGRIIETGPAAAILASPQHPYTRALVAAVPRATGPKRPRVLLRHHAGASAGPEPACNFASRCTQAMAVCTIERPLLRPAAVSSLVACHLAPTQILPSA